MVEDGSPLYVALLAGHVSEHVEYGICLLIRQCCWSFGRGKHQPFKVVVAQPASQTCLDQLHAFIIAGSACKQCLHEVLAGSACKHFAGSACRKCLQAVLAESACKQCLQKVLAGSACRTCRKCLQEVRAGSVCRQCLRQVVRKGQFSCLCGGRGA